MIHVTGNWFIDVDDTEYQSFEYKKSKTGTMVKSKTNYHYDLPKALKRILEEKKRETFRGKDFEFIEAVDALMETEDRCAIILQSLKNSYFPPIVQCKDCKLHDHCFTEERFTNIPSNRQFCGIGVKVAGKEK